MVGVRNTGAVSRMKSFQNWPGTSGTSGGGAEPHQPLLEALRLERPGERLLDHEHDAVAALAQDVADADAVVGRPEGALGEEDDRPGCRHGGKDAIRRGPAEGDSDARRGRFDPGQDPGRDVGGDLRPLRLVERLVTQVRIDLPGHSRERRRGPPTRPWGPVGRRRRGSRRSGSAAVRGRRWLASGRPAPPVPARSSCGGRRAGPRGRPRRPPGHVTASTHRTRWRPRGSGRPDRGPARRPPPDRQVVGQPGRAQDEQVRLGPVALGVGQRHQAAHRVTEQDHRSAVDARADRLEPILDVVEPGVPARDPGPPSARAAEALEVEPGHVETGRRQDRAGPARSDPNARPGRGSAAPSPGWNPSPASGGSAAGPRSGRWRKSLVEVIGEAPSACRIPGWRAGRSRPMMTPRPGARPPDRRSGERWVPRRYGPCDAMASQA